MRPEVPQDLLACTAQWEELHRGERRELGRALRRVGLTYNEIRDLIPVAKSTLSNWCEGIRLTDDLVDAIQRRSRTRRRVPRDTQHKRRREVEAIRAEAYRQAEQLAKQPLFVAGVTLYWGEGSKTQTDLTLSNADPKALRLFVTWVRSYLDHEAEFRLSLHLHGGNSESAAKAYWRSELNLPDVRFTKTYFKPPGSGHRKNSLKHGICRVRVCRSADHWHKTMAWIQYLGDRLA
jgi:hypothetical protein